MMLLVMILLYLTIKIMLNNQSVNHAPLNNQNNVNNTLPNQNAINNQISENIMSNPDDEINNMF